LRPRFASSSFPSSNGTSLRRWRIRPSSTTCRHCWPSESRSIPPWSARGCKRPSSRACPRAPHGGRRTGGDSDAEHRLPLRSRHAPIGHVQRHRAARHRPLQRSPPKDLPPRVRPRATARKDNPRLGCLPQLDQIDARLKGLCQAKAQMLRSCRSPIDGGFKLGSERKAGKPRRCHG
jgi:hypothetical protein